MAGLWTLLRYMSSWRRGNGRVTGTTRPVGRKRFCPMAGGRHSVIVQVVSALLQATWTTAAPTVVEPPDGATQMPQLAAMTWYSLVPTEVSVNASLLL